MVEDIQMGKRKADALPLDEEVIADGDENGDSKHKETAEQTATATMAYDAVDGDNTVATGVGNEAVVDEVRAMFCCKFFFWSQLSAYHLCM